MNFVETKKSPRQVSFVYTLKLDAISSSVFYVEFFFFLLNINDEKSMLGIFVSNGAHTHLYKKFRFPFFGSVFIIIIFVSKNANTNIETHKTRRKYKRQSIVCGIGLLLLLLLLLLILFLSFFFFFNIVMCTTHDCIVLLQQKNTFQFLNCSRQSPQAFVHELTENVKTKRNNLNWPTNVKNTRYVLLLLLKKRRIKSFFLYFCYFEPRAIESD